MSIGAGHWRPVILCVCQMVEEGQQRAVWRWRFVHVEVPTAGWSPPCCPRLSPYSCPASAEATSWRHIRSVAELQLPLKQILRNNTFLRLPLFLFLPGRCLWCLIWRHLPALVSWRSWSATKRYWWSWDGWSRRWRTSPCLRPHPPLRVWGRLLLRAQAGVGWAAADDRPSRPSEVLLLQVRHPRFYLALNLGNKIHFQTPVLIWIGPERCCVAVFLSLRKAKLLRVADVFWSAVALPLDTRTSSSVWSCVCVPAGVAFYSISDIADRLLSTPAHPMPSLEEGYWLSRSVSEPSGLLYTLLEELSPAAMAAFDLACCHCQLWKTSRQLLDTAERRLNSSLEARGRRFNGRFWIFRWFVGAGYRTFELKSPSAASGVRVDPKVPHSEGICGFPMVLQQITKILNHSTTNKSSVKTGQLI